MINVQKNRKKKIIKNPKRDRKDGVTHKSPLVMINIVKLVVNHYILNVKRKILKFLVRSISEKILTWK